MKRWKVVFFCVLGALVLLGAGAYWRYDRSVITFSIVYNDWKRKETVFELEVKGAEAKKLRNILALDAFYSRCDSLAMDFHLKPIIDIDYAPDFFSSYCVVGKNARGEQVFLRYLMTPHPFQVRLASLDEGEFYSIQEFFTKEEQKKMKQLIPGWTVDHKSSGQEQ